jgi:hypothetical protein
MITISHNINKPNTKTTLYSKNELFTTKKKFIKKLKQIEDYIISKRTPKYKNKKNTFNLNNFKWTTMLRHYVEKHKITPPKEFVDFVTNYQIITKNIVEINGTKAEKYVIINKNQILIIDALLEHGGYTKKYFDLTGKKTIRYTEHAGYLALNNELTSLSKVIVYGNTTSVDKNDQEIFFPNEDPTSFNFEYLFHTHPPTPEPGMRVIHEIPSIGDILHFIWHFNEGKTIGSLVLTSEGLYNVRKNDFTDTKIKVNEDKLYKNCLKVISNIHDYDFDKYSDDFDREYFYSVIAQDFNFINIYNDFLHKFNIHIDYFPRKKNKDNLWYIDDVYLPIKL